MAQNITLWGATYSAVPSVSLPKQGGGTASFTDVTDTTASAADVASGKYFYTSAGVRTQGTNSGGGSSVKIGTASSFAATNSTLSFPVLGNPTSYVVLATNTITPSNWITISAVVYDGTTVHGQSITDTSNAVEATLNGELSSSYSDGVLTITTEDTSFSTSMAYKLIYSYDGTSSNIHTADIQVGSGATSITFPSLSGRPIYWSCIFKSNFSTSSGYQRVIAVANDGEDIEGLAMDSSAKAQTSWTASYSGGSLTITSQGTNNGGYFHQPGYYQLTYAVDDSAPQYESVSKTYRASTSAQSETITPSSGYDAIEEVNISIPAVLQTNLIADNIKSGTTISISNGQSNLWNVTGTYSGGGGGSVQYDTKTATASDYPVSLAFTSMKGEPKAFVVRLNAQVSSSGSTTYYYIVDIAHFGTTTHGNCFRIGSTRRVDNITSGYSYTYSGTTLTITSSASSRSASPGAFYNGSYELLYAY